MIDRSFICQRIGLISVWKLSHSIGPNYNALIRRSPCLEHQDATRQIPTRPDKGEAACLTGSGHTFSDVQSVNSVHVQSAVSVLSERSPHCSDV